MTSEEHIEYCKRLQSFQVFIDSYVQMLIDCKNRSCVSHDKDELVRQFSSAVDYLKCIFDLNVQRIDFESSVEEK